MALEGSVTIHKRIRKHLVWERSDYGWAFVDLLLLANDQDRTVFVNGEQIPLKRGQLCWSLRSLEKEWNKSRSWMDKFMDFCLDNEMIRIDSTNRRTIITILNYDAYNPTKEHTEIRTDERTESHTEEHTDNGTDERTEVQQNIESRKEKKKGEGPPPRIVEFSQALEFVRSNGDLEYTDEEIRLEWLYFDSRRGPAGEWLTERTQVITDWRSALTRALMLRRQHWAKNGAQKTAGVWELKQRLEMLQKTEREHPGNEASAAYDGDPSESTLAELETVRQQIRDIEKQLTA